MTMQELKNKKTLLDANIQELLNMFTKETGLKVSSVQLEKVYSFPEDCAYIIRTSIDL